MPEGPATATARILCRQFPEAPALTLARRLWRENPELYSNLEHARGCVRQVFGQNCHRRRVSDKTLYRAARRAGYCPKGFPSLPEPWEVWDVLIPGCWGILADLHVPYHDREAIEVAVAHLRKLRPVGIILNGDLVDHYNLSDWQRDPRRRRFPDEVKCAKALLGWLRSQFPKAELIWKEGNHEERWLNYLRHRAPDILGLDVLELGPLYDCDKLGVVTVGDRRPIGLGSLTVLHGHEYRFAIQNPVNPARGLFLRSKVNALCSHFHQRSQHSERRADDKVISCWSTGCLCDRHPEWLPLNNWAAGFATVEIASDGAFNVTGNHVLIGNRVY